MPEFSFSFWIQPSALLHNTKKDILTHKHVRWCWSNCLWHQPPKRKWTWLQRTTRPTPQEFQQTHPTKQSRVPLIQPTQFPSCGHCLVCQWHGQPWRLCLCVLLPILHVLHIQGGFPHSQPFKGPSNFQPPKQAPSSLCLHRGHHWPLHPNSLYFRGCFWGWQGRDQSSSTPCFSLGQPSFHGRGGLITKVLRSNQSLCSCVLQRKEDLHHCGLA